MNNANTKSVKLLPLKKITAEMREHSHIEQVVLRRETYSKRGYYDVVLSHRLGYGNEETLHLFDSNLVIDDECDHDVSYFPKASGKSWRSKLKQLGFVLTKCTNG